MSRFINFWVHPQSVVYNSKCTEIGSLNSLPCAPTHPSVVGRLPFWVTYSRRIRFVNRHIGWKVR